MKNEVEKTENVHVATIQPRTEMPISTIDVANIDQLETGTVAPVDLMSDYWSPEREGDTKKVIFDRLDISLVLAQDTGELLELETAFFFIKEHGVVKQIRNGSKRLIGALQTYNIQRGAALEIKYMGKKQNRLNAFKSDNWSIKPILIQIKAH